MYHELMKTAARGMGSRYISGEGCLFLRRGKLNSHQETRVSNRWGDHSRCHSPGTTEPIPRKHHRSLRGEQWGKGAGENQSWGLGFWKKIWNRCNDVLSQHIGKYQPYWESPSEGIISQPLPTLYGNLSHTYLYSYHNPVFSHLLA